MCNCRYWWFLLILGFLHARRRGKFSKNTGAVYNEVACLVNAGLCVRRADCGGGLLAALPALCPAQRRHGVLCCHTTKLKHWNHTLNPMELLKNVTEHEQVDSTKKKKKKKKSRWKKKFNRLIR